MREVTKEKFYGPIYATNLNVHPSIVGNYPYTSVFRFLQNPNAQPYGKIADAVEDGLFRKRYFIND